MRYAQEEACCIVAYRVYSQVNIIFRSQCKCLDPNHKPKCGLPNYKGDGNCDDENNIKECDYDGGDCCQSPPKNAYCKQV